MEGKNGSGNHPPPGHFALAALNVGLYETHARQAGFIERADFNIIALDVAKLDTTV